MGTVSWDFEIKHPAYSHQFFNLFFKFLMNTYRYKCPYDKRYYVHVSHPTLIISYSKSRYMYVYILIFWNSFPCILEVGCFAQYHKVRSVSTLACLWPFRLLPVALNFWWIKIFMGYWKSEPFNRLISYLVQILLLQKKLEQASAIAIWNDLWFHLS